MHFPGAFWGFPAQVAHFCLPRLQEVNRVHLSLLYLSLSQGPCQAGHICDICGNLGQLHRLGILRSAQGEGKTTLVAQSWLIFFLFPLC